MHHHRKLLTLFLSMTLSAQSGSCPDVGLHHKIFDQNFERTEALVAARMAFRHKTPATLDQVPFPAVVDKWISKRRHRLPGATPQFNWRFWNWLTLIPPRRLADG